MKLSAPKSCEQEEKKKKVLGNFTISNFPNSIFVMVKHGTIECFVKLILRTKWLDRNADLP